MQGACTKTNRSCSAVVYIYILASYFHTVRLQCQGSLGKCHSQDRKQLDCSQSPSKTHYSLLQEHHRNLQHLSKPWRLKKCVSRMRRYRKTLANILLEVQVHCTPHQLHQCPNMLNRTPVPTAQTGTPAPHHHSVEHHSDHKELEVYKIRCGVIS